MPKFSVELEMTASQLTGMDSIFLTSKLLEQGFAPGFIIIGRGRPKTAGAGGLIRMEVFYRYPCESEG